MALRPGFQLDTQPTAISEYRILRADSVEELQAAIAAAIGEGLAPLGEVQRDRDGGFLQAVGVPVAVTPGGSSGVLFTAGTLASAGVRGVQPFATSAETGIGGTLTSYNGLADTLALGLGSYGKPAAAPGLAYVGAVDDLNEGDITARVIALSVSPSGVSRVPGSVQLLAANGLMPVVAFDSDEGLAYAFAADGASSTGQFTAAALRVNAGNVEQVGNSLVGALGFNIVSIYGAAFGAAVLDGHFCVAVADPTAGNNRKRLVSFAFDGDDFTQVDTLTPAEDYYSFVAGPTWLAGLGDNAVTFFTYTAAGGFVEAFTANPADLDAGALLTTTGTALYDSVADRFHFGLLDDDYTAGAVFVATPNFGASTLTLVARIDDLPEAQWNPYLAYGNNVFLPGEDYNGVFMANFTGANYEFLPGAYTGPAAEFFLLPLLEA